MGEDDSTAGQQTILFYSDFNIWRCLECVIGGYQVFFFFSLLEKIYKYSLGVSFYNIFNQAILRLQQALAYSPDGRLLRWILTELSSLVTFYF